jgi:hypothetical protein
MREGLSTAPCARRSGGGLSGPIFSGPHDCAYLVNSHQAVEIALINQVPLNILISGTRFEKEQQSNFRRLWIEED